MVSREQHHDYAGAAYKGAAASTFTACSSRNVVHCEHVADCASVKPPFAQRITAIFASAASSTVLATTARLLARLSHVWHGWHSLGR